jgi:hypothetical protein
MECRPAWAKKHMIGCRRNYATIAIVEWITNGVLMREFEWLHCAELLNDCSVKD